MPLNPEEQRHVIYAEQLSAAIEKDFDSLSEAEAIEWRRRMDAARGIVLQVLSSVRGEIHAAKMIEDHNKDENRIGGAGWALVAVGLVLHYIFRDASKFIDFTHGLFLLWTGIALVALCMIVRGRLQKALRAAGENTGKLQIPWRANGGMEDRLGQLFYLTRWAHREHLAASGTLKGTPEFALWLKELEADFISVARVRKREGVPSRPHPADRSLYLGTTEAWA